MMPVFYPQYFQVPYVPYSQVPPVPYSKCPECGSIVRSDMLQAAKQNVQQPIDYVSIYEKDKSRDKEGFEPTREFVRYKDSRIKGEPVKFPVVLSKDRKATSYDQGAKAKGLNPQLYQHGMKLFQTYTIQKDGSCDIEERLSHITPCTFNIIPPDYSHKKSFPAGTITQEMLDKNNYTVEDIENALKGKAYTIKESQKL